MSKEEIEKIELERDFYNIMTSYGKLGYKINKTIDELNEISELSNLMAKEKKELQERIDKAIEVLENNYLYHYGSEKRPVVFEDNYIQELYDILKGSEENDK